MAEHLETGKEGEEKAQTYLTDQGYEILDLNWMHGHVELDIIAQKDNVVVFVEVKTRSTKDFGSAESFVGSKKKQHLIKAVNAYVNKKNIDSPLRFDIIGVYKNHSTWEVDHIEDAFYFF
jgi:putative endonuclease